MIAAGRVKEKIERERARERESEKSEKPRAAGKQGSGGTKQQGNKEAGYPWRSGVAWARWQQESRMGWGKPRSWVRSKLQSAT